MPTLIHVNGPPGAGKSTLARAYAEGHPGVLALDIDRIAVMIGGWREDFFAAVRPARDLALVMAERHLRNGHDVVVPQLVASLDEVARFERTAARAGADYVEVALLVEPDEQRDRFRKKSEAPAFDAALDAAIAVAVARTGGDAVLERTRRDWDAYLPARPDARRLVTDGLGPAPSYAALVTLLGDVAADEG